MNKLILCEGATDAILLSYYLERTAGWKFVRQPPQGVSIRATEQNEEVTWYTITTTMNTAIMSRIPL